MTCKEVQAVIVEYLDQALDAATMEAVAAHLVTCEECRQEAEELQELMQTMVGSEVKRPGPGLRENFQLMLQSELNMVVADKLLHEGDAGGSGERVKVTEGDGTRERVTEGRGERMQGDRDRGRGNGKVIEWSSPVWKVAVAIVLLFGGIGIGALMSSRRASNPNTPNTPEQLVAMQKEIKEMKELLMFSLIDDESASQRIKAVSYAEEMPNPDRKVIEALVSTLNHDKNVNVRLAALYSLGSWADNRMVRDSLVASLPRQTEPLIQVMLINLLAEKKDSRIVGPIQDILSNKKTLPVVKDAAEKSLKTL
jgi:hypothetical protein